MAIIRTLSREVPHAGDGSNDELLNGDAESNKPEETKEVVNEHVGGLIFVFESGDEGTVVRYCISRGVKEYGSSDPPNEDWNANNVN